MVVVALRLDHAQFCHGSLIWDWHRRFCGLFSSLPNILGIILTLILFVLQKWQINNNPWYPDSNPTSGFQRRRGGLSLSRKRPGELTRWVEFLLDLFVNWSVPHQGGGRKQSNNEETRYIPWWRANQRPLVGKTLISSIPASNSLGSDPWRVFWADTAPFKGPLPRCVSCFRHYRGSTS